MWRDGDIALVHGKAAVASGGIYVSCDIPSVGRADVDDWPERTTGALFLFDFLDGLVCRQVKVAFAVAHIDTHAAVPPFRADIEKGVHLCFPLKVNAQFERAEIFFELNAL